MIELILGSMKSGKSKALFDRIDRALWSTHPRVCLIRPACDTREFITRSDVDNGEFARFTRRSLLDEIDEFYRFDTICIDEGQFFPDLGEAMWILSRRGGGKDVYAACLQGDRDMRPWAAVSDAIPYADRIVQVHAVCEYCGDKSKSTFTFYDGPPSSDQVVIGDGEYHAACAECWREQTSKKS
jgi:thymidine kinase